MWHLLLADQQESFHPFSSLQGLSYFLSPCQKGALKPCGIPFHQSCLVPSFLTKATWSPPSMAVTPGFKSQCQSSSAAPFLTPPTISYTCQHSRIFPAFLGFHNKSGQVWPMTWSQPSPGSQAGTVTRGSYLPVTS